MKIQKTFTLLTSILVFCLAGCASPSTPTASLEQETAQPATFTEVSPTDTPTIPPTDTPVPPTPTPSPTDTATATITRTPTPEVKNEPVTFTTADDITLVGNLFGEGDIAVILTHMGEIGTTRTSWFPFARFIAANGYTALAFDFRGWGASGGDHSYSKQKDDVLAAADFLRERGHERIICMGASMGGIACFNAALETDMVGLVVLAGGPVINEEIDYSILTMPKLFICEEGDPYELIPSMIEMFDILPEPKEFVLIPGDAHGTRLFNTPAGDELRQLLTDFLDGFR